MPNSNPFGAKESTEMETVSLDGSDVKKGAVPAKDGGPFADDKPLLEGK